MRIAVESLALHPQAEGALQRSLVEQALRLAARDLPDVIGGQEQPIQLGKLNLNLQVPFAKVQSGEMTERAAAALVGRVLVDAVLAQLAPDVLKMTQEGRKAFLFFGEELPTRARTLEQLLADRIQGHRGDPDSAHWLTEARRALSAVPDLAGKLADRDRRIVDWAFSADLDADHPLAKRRLNDTYHKAAAKARKLLKELRAAATTPEDYWRAIRAEIIRFRAGDDEQKKVATLLSHFVSEVEKEGRAELYAQDPALAELDEVYRAARMALGSIPDAPPLIKLPAGVPGIGDLADGLAHKFRGKEHGAKAVALAQATIAMAKRVGDPTHQYWFIELRIQTYRRSAEPEKALAALLLSRFLEEQKTAWVPQHIEQLLAQAPQGHVTYNPADDVSYEGSDQSLPADSRHVKKVQEAWDRIRRIAHPDLLNKVGPCKVKIHKNPLFRAHYSNREVHVASFESVPVIMHELGHHLEDKGGLENWVRVQRLLHERAAGGLKLINVFTPSELRYGADMPVTGKYSAKYYEHGSTEVISMGLEYMADPKKAAQLYLKDPEMFAAVLGSLNPMRA